MKKMIVEMIIDLASISLAFAIVILCYLFFSKIASFKRIGRLIQCRRCGQFYEPKKINGKKKRLMVGVEKDSTCYCHVTLHNVQKGS